jgi:NAD-dependent SIR2 family protein deacetylase
MVSQTATLKQTTLTCVGCGSTVAVDDSPENIRNKTCEKCGAALMERRLPGSSE